MERPESGFKLQNPLVLRVGQVMTGFGFGCGLGIGIGVPIPMDIPGVAQVMGAANGMTRHIGGGRQLQGLIKRVGIKNLEAGIGCGVGLGHGFGVGLALKPGASQQILHVFQERFSTILSKVRPHAHEKPSGLPDAGVQESAGKPFQSPFTSPVMSAPSIKNSESEVEKLRSQNEILRTLLRHQEKIEDLEHENELLRERLDINRSLVSKGLNSEHKCFDCRMVARRRN